MTSVDLERKWQEIEDRLTETFGGDASGCTRDLGKCAELVRRFIQHRFENRMGYRLMWDDDPVAPGASAWLETSERPGARIALAAGLSEAEALARTLAEALARYGWDRQREGDLKVYKVTLDIERTLVTAMVAAGSLHDAGRTLGKSESAMQNYAYVSDKVRDVRKALAEPGTVFVQLLHARRGTWMRVEEGETIADAVARCQKAAGGGL